LFHRLKRANANNLQCWQESRPSLAFLSSFPLQLLGAIDEPLSEFKAYGQGLARKPLFRTLEPLRRTVAFKRTSVPASGSNVTRKNCLVETYLRTFASHVSSYRALSRCRRRQNNYKKGLASEAGSSYQYHKGQSRFLLEQDDTLHWAPRINCRHTGQPMKPVDD
jgi:hypothetical protein